MHPDASLQFRPLPLLSNPHVQTLLGYLLPGPDLRRVTREQILWLPDGVVPLDTERLPPLPFWTAVTTIIYNVAIAVAAVRSF